MIDLKKMQLTSTLVCFIAILCLNIFICEGYHHVGFSKSIVRDRVYTSLFYDANFFNLERVDISDSKSNSGRRMFSSTSLSMSSSDDGIGKVKYFSILTNYE